MKIIKINIITKIKQLKSNTKSIKRAKLIIVSILLLKFNI